MASIQPISNEDVIEWPDGDWCYREALPEMAHKSDDYIVHPVGSPTWQAIVEGAADPLGWIPWGGGGCPVGYAARVVVRFRDGDVNPPGEGRGYDWRHRGTDSDIVAYKIVEEKQT